MKPKFGFVDSELQKIKNTHLLRKLRFGKVNGAKIIINGKNLLNLCSNDYLGIPPSKLKISQMQSSSRLISGNDSSFQKLEKKLARHKSQQSALIFPTGYMANLGVVSAIAKKGDIILSDELNHASLIEACKLSGKIKQKSNNTFVITEGVFSMDGDFSRLPEITEISQKQNAITVLDDAHGDFVVGQDGKGTANYFRISKKIDLYISSLSKGLGSFGGYVASKSNVIEYCTNSSKSFIYTSALPSFLVQYSLKQFDSNREKQRRKLAKNTQLLLTGLKEIGYSINSKTHIIPIIIGNEKTAMTFGKFLYENGIFAQPIRFPTVPKNQARIRLSVTAWLSERDIEKTLEIFEWAFLKFLK